MELLEHLSTEYERGAHLAVATGEAEPAGALLRGLRDARASVVRPSEPPGRARYTIAGDMALVQTARRDRRLIANAVTP